MELKKILTLYYSFGAELKGNINLKGNKISKKKQEFLVIFQDHLLSIIELVMDDPSENYILWKINISNNDIKCNVMF